MASMIGLPLSGTKKSAPGKGWYRAESDEGHGRADKTRQGGPVQPLQHQFAQVRRVDQMLQSDLAAPRKQRHTVKRIFDRLLDEHGVEAVTYPIVRNYAADQRSQIAVETCRARGRRPRGGPSRIRADTAIAAVTAAADLPGFQGFDECGHSVAAIPAPDGWREVWQTGDGTIRTAPVAGWMIGANSIGNALIFDDDLGP
ncbi:hypothetical protein ACIRP3_43290 [Streptomyces sp. NPDC101209]|uniref:hypothetical protein n=1 Tax=Streptomyces sp. NPDC101209 TaxID=3366129 RepID=UPI0037F14A9B